MSKKKYVVWAAAGIAVLAGVIVFCVLAFGGNAKARELEEQLSLANRYLRELDYENAVAAFQSALEIEPKSEEAYLGLADAYVGLGDYEAALQALTEGIEKTQSDALRAKLSEVEALAGISGADEDGAASDGAGGGAAPDGEEQADGRNAYGAIVFEERADYREFSELTAREQELVETCVNAATAHEGGLLDAVSDAPEFSLLTKYGEYKVDVLLRQITDSDSTTFVAAVEVRPESGMGYWYYETAEEGEFGTGEDENAGEYAFHGNRVRKDFQWYECPCTDWQWNGSVSGKDYMEEKSDTVYPNKGELNKHLLETRSFTYSGSAVMGLLQGDYVTEYQKESEETYDSGEAPSYSSDAQTVTESYENGWLQFDDGSWYLYSVGSGLYIGERVEELTGLPEDILEEIFW